MEEEWIYRFSSRNSHSGSSLAVNTTTMYIGIPEDKRRALTLSWPASGISKLHPTCWFCMSWELRLVFFYIFVWSYFKWLYKHLHNILKFASWPYKSWNIYLAGSSDEKLADLCPAPLITARLAGHPLSLHQTFLCPLIWSNLTTPFEYPYS